MPGGNPSRALNPLWIISLFLGLSEVTVGIAATQAVGWVQGTLAIFSVIFPACIAASFFWILWRKPFVLYAPRDYPLETSVSAFVEAMTVSANGRIRGLDPLVKSAMESALEKLVPDTLDPELVSVSVQQAILNAREKVEESLVYVDISDIKPNIKSVAIPVLDEMTAQEFMDELWLHLDPEIPPYTYGETWEIEDPNTGRPLIDADNKAFRRHLNSGGYTRRVREFNVKPGDKLIVRRRLR